MRLVGLAVAIAAAFLDHPLHAQAEPSYLRDRGTGVRMSMLGTYVREGELLAYPFFEWYADHNAEYKPNELGYGTSDVDYRGRYRASEGIFFLAYGISRDVAIEVEGAVITAEQRTSPSDTSTGRPFAVRESGLGDVEGQIRWRTQRETERRPEIYTFFEVVLPLQRRRHIIGTQDWEFSSGVGLTKGYHWGTMTVRAGVEYADKQVDVGEYAIEYMRQIKSAWRVIGAIEGSQVDEISLLTEVQWFFSPHARIKLNNGWGLTPNATDIAPEVGIMFSF